MSQFHYLSDKEIFASIDKDATYYRALVFDHETSLAVLVIPADSRYHNPKAAGLMLTLLTQLGLEPRIYKAAGSDDLHIYLSFAEKIDSDELNRRLSSLLMHNGFEISKETLVVCPSDIPLALPLQPGFAWLNDDLEVKLLRDDIALEPALALFISDMTRCLITYETLVAAAPQAGSVNSRLIYLPTVVEASASPIGADEFIHEEPADTITENDLTIYSLTNAEQNCDYATSIKPDQAIYTDNEAEMPRIVEQADIPNDLNLLDADLQISPNKALEIEEGLLPLDLTLTQLNPQLVETADHAAQSKTEKHRSRPLAPPQERTQLLLFPSFQLQISEPPATQRKTKKKVRHPPPT